MSTRAIIGIELEKFGKILGAWQWNDGGNMTEEFLNKHFHTLETASKLVSVGMWGAMYTLKEKEEFETLCDNNNIPRPLFVEVEGVYLSTQSHYKDRKPIFYKDYEQVKCQDVRYTYIFDKDTCKWKKRRTI